MYSEKALEFWREWCQTQLMVFKNVDDLEPWAMPLVLRVEKSTPVNHQDALSAAAQAVAVLLTDEKSAPGQVWHDDTKEWMQRRIRKLTRRARASKWERVVENCEGIVVCSGTAEVFVGVPHPVAKTPELISGLQIGNLELDMDPNYVPSEKNLQIAMNPDFKLSTGKAMAQVGHVAQLALVELEKSEVQAWAQDGFEASIVSPSYFSSPLKPSVAIHDAGFTEIPAGTLTAKAWL